MGCPIVKLGSSGWVSAVVPSNSTSATAIGKAIIDAINDGAFSNTYTATQSSNVVTLQRQVANTADAVDYSFNNYPAMTIATYDNFSSTSAATASYTWSVNKALTKGWRVTAVNNSFTRQGANLEAGMYFFSDTAGGETISFTAVGADAQYANTTSSLQKGWSIAAASVSNQDGTAAGTADYTAWF